jgi:hypothetical protein
MSEQNLNVVKRYVRSIRLKMARGRVEMRRCYATDDISWLRRKAECRGIRSIVMVESKRSVAGQEPSRERRYYISSLEAYAGQLNRVVRGHWSIENSLR